MEVVEDSSETDSEESELTYEEQFFCNLHQFFALLAREPSRKAELEKDFTAALFNVGTLIEEKGDINLIIGYYETSLELYPNNAKILNNLAAYLLKTGNPTKAIAYLEKALKADEKLLSASRNLQNACSMAVDRWHFPMLNDRGRNEAFDKAIRKKVLQGYDTVLDIGTGTGLLSLYARDAGAKKIFTCEICPVMSGIAKQVFQRNKAADNVQLICKLSNDVHIPTDIPERVKLIVAEIFDAALLGELVIPTLVDAHKRLLKSNGKGLIIPMRASLYVAAVECEYIRFRSSLVLGESQSLGSLMFDGIVAMPDENYYDTENLENVPVNNITEPKPIVWIDFNDLRALNAFGADGLKNVVESSCRYDGVIDGLVAWFKLDLDEEITLDSSQGESCWQLAVFPTRPMKVKSGDRVKIAAATSDGILKCSCDLDLKNREADEDDLVYRLPRDVITFLNDREYVDALVEQAMAKKDEEIGAVFDTSPFPIYGLTLLKENESCRSLYYQTENEDLQHFIRRLFSKNNIIGELRFISHPSELDSRIGSVYVHSFDTKGELLDWGEQSYKQIYSDFVSSAEAILPTRIDLIGQLVYSEELAKIVSVKDDNLQRSELSNEDSGTSSIEESSAQQLIDNSDLEDCKYVVAEYINKFKINQVFDLNSSLYNYTALSEPMYLTTMDGSESKETIVNFGKISEEKNIAPNALICWYKVFLNDNGHETKRNNSFMNHMAVVFEDELQEKVKETEDVRIKIEQMYDLVRLSVA